ncbi:serine protease AprX [Jatrophihabitans endophyticus]|uniref:Serine protease AprX n=1 Tax=Jatrophihabitans endophyticus TaxID=1206085 RepID=A0A1M5E5L4_9ACTN|nr:S8 family serine peptidase [Jatrophihabitans endophyticus]SHF74434.1 serine protease AprX [Jatrophihabitans endophyticus]
MTTRRTALRTSVHTTRWGRCAAAVALGAATAATLVVATPGAPAAAAPNAPSGTVTAAVKAARDWLASGGALWGDHAADKAAVSTGQYAAATDPGSLYTVERAIGARRVWASNDSAGHAVTGKGIAVALLDSGVARVSGLDGQGKVTYGPDLSVETNGVLDGADTYGHGTHLAGIIAGRDTAAKSAKLATQDPNTQLGVAPDAQVEALKLATTDGSTDVSQVIAGLDWIVQHPVTADGTRIRVVNLAYGTDSVQPYQVDPLAAAVENAWRHGLVVVVSGGNEGRSAGRLTDPATDPYVLAVGASDGGDTVAGWATPSVADFSSSGSAQRHVDLLAPGRSVVSLRDPGSFVDTNHPEGRVDGDSAGRLFRGSGTSQAAAVVSGAVALLLQAYPNLTPDQVKYVLTRSATDVAAAPADAGAGQLNIASALDLARSMTSLLGRLTTASVTQSWPAATGTGSLDAARGGSRLVDAEGTELAGEIDVQGQPWDGATWWAAASAANAWDGGSWNGAIWTGTGWRTGSSWDAARWSSARWSSARWSDADWDSARWSSARWSSARWSSARWSSARWSDADWDSARWSAAAWA